MSLRPAAARRPVTRSLAAVLAAGQQRESTTSGLFGKTDYKEKFRAALMKNKMDKAEAAAAKLTTAQIKQLEKEFKKYEEAGWKDQADNTALEAMEGPNRDSWKGQMERVEAQQKILRAHHGLGALHLDPSMMDIEKARTYFVNEFDYRIHHIGNAPPPRRMRPRRQRRRERRAAAWRGLCVRPSRWRRPPRLWVSAR